MRIIGFFVKLFLFLFGVAVFVYFIGAKGWVLLGSYMFTKDARQLTDLGTTAGDYVKTCQSAPAASGSSIPLAFQLRFVDSRTYQIEVVCSLIEDTPLLVKTGTLLPFIQKLPGSSGLYYSLRDGTTTAVTLGVLQDKVTVTLTLDKLSQKFGATAPVQATLLRNTCSGFGYQCCGTDSQKGTGELQTAGITDCPATCYASCQAVPFFSAFVPDPFPSVDRTILMTNESLLVTFSYTLDLVGNPVSQVEIDYGDGTTDTATQAVGIFTHTYNCTGPCTYTVSIKGTDSQGVSTADTENTRYILKKE